MVQYCIDNDSARDVLITADALITADSHSRHSARLFDECSKDESGQFEWLWFTMMKLQSERRVCVSELLQPQFRELVLLGFCFRCMHEIGARKVCAKQSLVVYNELVF